MTDTQQPKKHWIVSQQVWIQTTGSYDAKRRTRTLLAYEDTTVGQIAQWANRNAKQAVGWGDLSITELEETP